MVKIVFTAGARSIQRLDEGLVVPATEAAGLLIVPHSHTGDPY